MLYDILVARSTDNGATWTAPDFVDPNAPGDVYYDHVPQVTTDGAGNWLAVWESSVLVYWPDAWWDGILVARSTDNGATWTDPSILSTPLELGRNWSPQVTTDGAGNWAAVWMSNDSLGGTIGTDMDILVARSTDNGATWTAPAALNTNAASDSRWDRSPQVTTDGAGNWLAVWSSYDSLGGTIGTDADVLYATEGVAPPAPVGGIAELPDVSDPAGRNYVALAGLAAAVVIALGAGGWYARRRFSRG